MNKPGEKDIGKHPHGLRSVTSDQKRTVRQHGGRPDRADRRLEKEIRDCGCGLDLATLVEKRRTAGPAVRIAFMPKLGDQAPVEETSDTPTTSAFALLAYQSAWLRHHFPTEYYVALFNNQPMGSSLAV
jgi:hypothetical protein